MRPSILLSAALAVAPLPAWGQAIALGPGEAVTLRVGEKSPSERGRAEWTPYDLAVARHLVGQPVPEAPVDSAEPVPRDMPEAPPLRPGAVRLRFLSIAGRHSLLIVENGYDQALVYRARMTYEGRTRPTDVCLVRPGQRGFEHWPNALERIELYQVELVPWREGDPQPCR